MSACLFACWIVCHCRAEGVRGFFKGIFPNMYRVAPASAMTLVVYEKVKVLLGG